MLASLHIENIAVVKSLDIDIGEGLTVLSGETGAGKSIIIDSLGLLLGAKAERELLRTGETRALVSALFCDIGEDKQKKLSDIGIECEDGSLLLSRTLTPSSSSARIGGRAVTVAMLREVGAMLINIHGQNDNGQLLDAKNHIRLLDTFVSNSETLEEYGALYRDILHTRAELETIHEDTLERVRLCEMLKFQIEDIEALKLKRGEEEALEELVKRLSDSERINKACALADKALRGGEKVMGALYLVDRAAGALDAISDAIPDASALCERLTNIKYELDDIAESARDICDIGEGDPTARLDKAQARLSAIAKLKRKYGSTVEEILEYKETSAKRLADLENADEKIEELTDALSRLEDKARGLAQKLRIARKSGAEEISRRVCQTLAFLDMPKVRFEVRVTPTEELSAYGLDRVEFLISTNVGEPLSPMEKIASGGELARIMLSLKNVLNECDGVETVIFDEIDTGISGKTSRKVGMKLKEISGGAQVLCVTHSAQIASLAHNHLKIYKTEEAGRVSTAVKELCYDERVEEISRILGGIEISDAVRAAAKEMIEEF